MYNLSRRARALALACVMLAASIAAPGAGFAAAQSPTREELAATVGRKVADAVLAFFASQT